MPALRLPSTIILDNSYCCNDWTKAPDEKCSRNVETPEGGSKDPPLPGVIMNFTAKFAMAAFVVKSNSLFGPPMVKRESEDEIKVEDKRLFDREGNARE